MAFVLRRECAFLPRELARLHVPGLDLKGEWSLAPYAIDDASDELWSRRERPTEWLWLATETLPGLVWGLHDWAHFHNHGPFEERAWTELQCDTAALVWLWINRAVAGVSEDEWGKKRREVAAVARERFEEEGKCFDASFVEGCLEADRLRQLAAALT
jgi:hypothetical protein